MASDLKLLESPTPGRRRWRGWRTGLAGAALALLQLASMGSGAVEINETPCDASANASGALGNFTDAAARIAPAVVSVVVLLPRRSPFGESYGVDFFRPLASAPQPRSAADLQPGDGNAAASFERSFSSGFILAADGLVLTSAHAVYEAQEIWVLTADARRFQAVVTGLDRPSDVALLKIAASGLPSVQVSEAPTICPGEAVAALGSPFGFDASVTAGIVSAYPRFLPGGGPMALIQTDVALNPGSSGGPLFNAQGMVVGMNSMIYSANGVYSGVAFALPAASVLQIAAELKASGFLQRGSIGIATQPVTGELAQAFGLQTPGGALVIQVDAASTAREAGLRSGDIVLSVNAGGSSSHAAIEERIAAARPGESLAIDLWRDRALRRTLVKVQALASDMPRKTNTKPRNSEVRLGLDVGRAKVSSRMPDGLYVHAVSGSSLLAGIEPGDRIAAVNSTPVGSLAELDTALEPLGSSPVVAVLVRRGSVAIYLAVQRDQR